MVGMNLIATKTVDLRKRGRRVAGIPSTCLEGSNEVEEWKRRKEHEEMRVDVVALRGNGVGCHAEDGRRLYVDVRTGRNDRRADHGRYT